MSNKSTAADYVKSYVGNNTNSDEYLSQQQPRYDPNKPISQPQTTPLEQDPVPEPVQASEHWKMHLPTQNPIPSSEKTSAATAEETQTQQPEIVWTARDFKEQRSEIHETSLTVCADLHENLMTCFKDGSWWDKAKMCEDQKQKFWTCYNTQKKFLKGVNYKGPVTTEKENNRILLEAYKLRDKLESNATTTKEK